jgi:tricorn protease
LSSGSAERDPVWSPDGKDVSYFSDKSGAYTLVLEEQDGLKPPREFTLPNPAHDYTALRSPDSKRVAYAGRFRSLYRAVFVPNVDAGETKQVTDGLVDAMYPEWDASGKSLWFFASTGFGLRSQWLDMTSYDREKHFGLYLAVLKKGEPIPRLPDGAEDSRTSSAPAQGSGRPPAGPRGGFFTRDNRWAVETEGVGPDIDVENWR